MSELSLNGNVGDTSLLFKQLTDSIDETDACINSCESQLDRIYEKAAKLEGVFASTKTTDARTRTTKRPRADFPEEGAAQTSVKLPRTVRMDSCAAAIASFGAAIEKASRRTFYSSSRTVELNKMVWDLQLQRERRVRLAQQAENLFPRMIISIPR